MNTVPADNEKLRRLIKGFSTAVLITHTADCTLRARPMVIADITECCDLWFITNDESAKVQEIENEKTVHVVCQKDHSVYLSIAGVASVVRDRRRIEEIWKEPFRVWFPDGPSDPHLVLMHVTPDRAEYWDNQGLNKVSYMWEAAIAYVSGETPRVPEGEQHGVVSLA